jgi:hypothetical protein
VFTSQFFLFFASPVSTCFFFSLALLEVKWNDKDDLSSSMKNILHTVILSTVEDLSLSQFAQFIQWYAFAFGFCSLIEILFSFLLACLYFFSCGVALLV